MAKKREEEFLGWDFSDRYAAAPEADRTKFEPLRIAVDQPKETLSEGERGLVMSQYLNIWVEGRCIESCVEDPWIDEMFFATLFWDKIDIPCEYDRRWNHLTTIKTLDECGIIVRTNYKVEAGRDGRDELYGLAQQAVFKQRNEREAGRWAVGRAPDGSSFRKSDLVDNDGVSFRLYRSLLVPDYHTPVYELLEFRDRRRAELLALRAHIERISLSIAGSGNRELAFVREMEDLDKALRDYLRVIKETRFSLSLSDLQAEFNIGAGLGAMIGAYSAGLGLSAALLAGVGGTLGSATLTASAGLKGKGHVGSPFEYVARFHSEGIGTQRW